MPGVSPRPANVSRGGHVSPSLQEHLHIRDAIPGDAEGIVKVLNPIIAARIYTVFDTLISVEAERDFIQRFPERGRVPRRASIGGPAVSSAFRTWSRLPPIRTRSITSAVWEPTSTSTAGGRASPRPLPGDVRGGCAERIREGVHLRALGQSGRARDLLETWIPGHRARREARQNRRHGMSTRC